MIVRSEHLPSAMASISSNDILSTDRPTAVSAGYNFQSSWEQVIVSTIFVKFVETIINIKFYFFFSVLFSFYFLPFLTLLTICNKQNAPLSEDQLVAVSLLAQVCGDRPLPSHVVCVPLHFFVTCLFIQTSKYSVTSFIDFMVLSTPEKC